jgi:hypothetical protein
MSIEYFNLVPINDWTILYYTPKNLNGSEENNVQYHHKMYNIKINCNKYDPDNKKKCIICYCADIGTSENVAYEAWQLYKYKTNISFQDIILMIKEKSNKLF